MNEYVAEAFATGRIADFHREAAAARVAARVPRLGRQHPWTALATRLAAWAEGPRAGRSTGVCCPA